MFTLWKTIISDKYFWTQWIFIPIHKTAFMNSCKVIVPMAIQISKPLHPEWLIYWLTTKTVNGHTL